MSNERKVLTANATVGIGMWTSICVMFAGIFGVQSFNLKKKQMIVLDSLIESMQDKIRKYAQFYKPVGMDLWFSGPLKATMSLTMEETENKYETHFGYHTKNKGIGLLTATFKSFADILGVTSQVYLEKMNNLVEERAPLLKDKEFVQHVTRKPSALNVVQVFLYHSNYIEPSAEEEQKEAVVEEKKEKIIVDESCSQVNEETLKDMDLIDKSSLKIGDIVYINHHEYNEMAKKSLNPGDKVIVKEINEESVIVLVDKQYSSFVAEVQFDNLKR